MLGILLVFLLPAGYDMLSEADAMAEYAVSEIDNDDVIKVKDVIFSIFYGDEIITLP